MNNYFSNHSTLSDKYDHNYLDLSIINNDTTGTNPPINLVFNETRNSPYLYNPSEYYMSIVRFSLDTPSLPVFIPQVELKQTDVNKTIYSFSMTYKTYTYQQYISWIPQDLTQPLPNAPLDVQDFTSEYYFCFNHSHWIRCINTAIVNCFNGLKALVVAGGDVLPTNNSPFMSYESPSSITSLYFDKAGFDSSLTNPISFYMNSPLYTLFSSYDVYYLGYQNVANGLNYKFNVYSKNGLNEVPITNPSSYTALKMVQEYNTTALWNPVQTLVFTSALMPVAPSMVGLPKVWNSYADLLGNGVNNNLSPIMTDLEVQMTTGNDYKPNVLYNPLAEYRLLDLLSNSPVNAIEISCFWKTQFGNLIPFKLLSGCSASIKILFRKKSVGVAK